MFDEFLMQIITQLEQAQRADDAVGGHALVGSGLDDAVDDLDRAENVLGKGDPAVGGGVAVVGDVGPSRRRRKRVCFEV